jgi:GT2 family glycosyltransferase
VTWEAVPGTVYTQPEPEELIDLTVIVPVRNEQDCLADCLQSPVSQSLELLELGTGWEPIVVDDDSNGRPAEIARSIEEVTVIEADQLELGWVGKNNAVWTAAKRARGRVGCDR